jgi:uncharacterized protein with NAD-binding domain and iron-sulfur cluster
MSESPGRKKIAILGGGAGALAAAFGLTEAPDWQQRCEITVYQVGWRLGGKGASGRNAGCHQRIEEHGLHVWAGFYENAFRLMRACYERLGRPAGAPLATVWDAFKPQTNITLTEETDTGWDPVNVELPVDPGDCPGSGAELPGVWTWIRRVIVWMRQRLEELAAITEEVRVAHPHLLAVEEFVQRLVDDVREHTAITHDVLLNRLARFRDRLHALHDRAVSGRARLIWSMLDLACTSLKGIVEDGVLFHGFFSIDHWEWSDWLRHHGIHETTLQSAVVRGTYDYVFGFAGGDVKCRSVAAGTCTHGLLRLGFTWRGAVFYEMQAGMGDAVFAPLYECLSRQGVRFRFFHRIDHLGLDTDRKRIETITVSRQVNLKDPRPEAEYDPLVKVKGLPCWPSAPRYDQLDERDARELQEKGIDLESPWADWQPRATLHLSRGTDFDDVILGISLGALSDICTELCGKGQPALPPAQQRWKDMLERIETVPTLAMQLWLTPDARGLGWPYADRQATILTAFADPFNTWGDLSHLLEREDWPAGDGPLGIAYFCGPMLDVPGGPPPPTDHDFPDRQRQQVRKEADCFLPRNLRALWPAAFDDAGQFRWELLVAPEAAAGAQRLDAQYWRANVSPSERYVLSVPGSTPYRLAAGDSGFENLYLAGDWVRTGINAGCVEAAVMAGFRASQALCGYPQEVIGDPD